MTTKINIVLVNPPGDILIDEHLEPPLGLLSIASYIQEKLNIRPVILDLTEYSVGRAKEVIKSYKADIFGFTIYCTKWDITKELIYIIRDIYGKYPLVVVGGPNPTAMPNETFQFKDINIVVTGEGEKAFYQIVTEYKERKINYNTRKIINGDRLLENEFPVLDRTFIDFPEKYGRKCFNKPVINLEASRGCPHRCIFCNSIVMGGHNKVTAKSPKKIIQEITECKQRGYDIFRFNDDSFTYAAYKNGLLDQLKPLKIKYRIFANAKHLIKTSLVQKLKNSGCFHISVGIESYDPNNLKIIGKNTTQEDIKVAIRNVHELGIVVRVYFIVGLPFDTDETINNYMNKVVKEVDFDEYSVYPLIPYPGTDIYKFPEKYGYKIINNNINDYIQIGKGNRTTIALRHNNFDEVKIANWLETTENIFQSYGKVQTLNSKVV